MSNSQVWKNEAELVQKLPACGKQNHTHTHTTKNLCLSWWGKVVLAPVPFAPEELPADRFFSRASRDKRSEISALFLVDLKATRAPPFRVFVCEYARRRVNLVWFGWGSPLCRGVLGLTGTVGHNQVKVEK